MPFKPGDDPNRNLNGRPKGKSNKVTMEIREAYQNLVEMNLDQMSLWIQSVASEDPGKAFDLMLKLSEYVIPRLARQEVTGADGKDIFEGLKFDFGPSVNDETKRIQDIEGIDLDDY